MSIDARQVKIQALSTSTTAIAAGDTLEDIAGKAQGQVNAHSSSITRLSALPVVRTGAWGNRKTISFGSMPPHYTTLSDGVQTVETSRMKYRAIGNLFDIAVHYSNLTPINNTTTAGVGDMTLTASIEYPAGTFTQLTFSGNASYVLKAYTRTTTDVALVEIPTGVDFWVRTCVTVVSGQKWTKSLFSASAYSEGAVAGTDATMSGTITNSTTSTFGPAAIIGNSTTNAGSVFLLGDSISFGTNDSGYTAYSTGVGGGLFGRAFGNAFPTVMTNIPSQKLNNWASNKFRLSHLFSATNFFICQLAINDILTNDTLATVQANLINLLDSFRVAGVYGYQTTITPRTSSTDSWATTANQTVSAQESTRLSLNAWIRDGAPLNVSTRVAVTTGDASATTVRAGDARHPLSGYFEVADTVETARNSGIWKAPGYTTDGLHGTSTSYPLMAAAIDTTKFNLW
jgi:lysophospholipase L1-like esterase